jgi:ribosomal protein L11 methylase PrmA
VLFQVADLSAATLPAADIVTANLTGALLQRSAAALMSLVKPGGSLIVSGYLEDEREQVRAAFSALTATKEREEQGWMGLSLKKA